MNDRPEALIRELARDLRPVRVIAPLRAWTAGVALLGAACAAAAVVWLGPNPALDRLLVSYPAFAAIGLGLVLLTVGGIVAGLAASVPGREGLARIAGSVALLGALVAVGLGSGLALTGPEAAVPLAPLSMAGRCLGRALVLGTPAAALALIFVLRAHAAHTARAVAAASAGAVALGALVSHLTCGQVDVLHLIVGHALPPVAGALLIVPVLGLVRRLRHRHLEA